MTVKLYERADSEFVLNGTTAGIQSLAKIAWISSSRYIAVWTHDPLDDGISNPQVRAQIFEADGTAVGSEFTVNSTDVAAQTNAVVTKLAGGGFVVAWEDRYEATDGSGSSIRYQVYGADGLPIGGESPANMTTQFDQSRPSIAGLEGGGFVITWTDDSRTGGDSSGLAVRGQLFGANGAPVGAEFLVNTITHRGQTASNVTALAGGGFAVVWQDESPQGIDSQIQAREDYGTNIAIQIFDSVANKVGTEQVVDDMTPPVVFGFTGSTGRLTAMNPVATLLPDGKLAVVWTDAADGYVKTRQLNADGTPATAVFNVGDAFGTLHPAPSIVTLADGGYAIGWTASGEGPPDGSGRGVLARVFAADGSPQGVEFQVNSTTEGNQLASTMLAFADGGFLVAWHDGTTTDLAAQRFAEDSGTISDIALSVGSISKGAIENVQAAILSADGALNAPFTYQILNDPTGAFRLEGDRLVVADTALLFAYGPNRATISFRVTDSNGNSYDEAIEIPLTGGRVEGLFEAGAQTQISVSNQSGAQTAEIAALPNGGYFVTWLENGSPGNFEVMGQFHEADGSHGAAFVVNTLTAGSQFEPFPVVLANGNIVVTWVGPPAGSFNAANRGDIRAQILDPSGAKIGGEFVVNTVIPQIQSRAITTALADGGFLVTWADSSLADDPSVSGVKAQFFTADGAKVGGEFLVNSTTAGAQTSPYAAQLQNGTIVIAWTDSSATGDDTSGTAVRARLYDADGTPLGGEFLVNSTTLHSQSAPVVTVLADGRFVVVWNDTSEGTGSSGAFDPADLRAQIYDMSGNRIGGEILVNSETSGFQGQGSLGAAGVSADAYGGFVVTWASYYQENSDGESGAIKAQLFGADGDKVGGEFLVNEVGEGQQGTSAVAYLGDGDLIFTWWDLVGPRTGGNRAISARRFDSQVQSDLPFVVYQGTSADETWNGTSGPDLIYGDGGHDTLSAGGGDDIVHGGDGDDFLLGEDGDDQLYGDEGYDLLRGGAGVDSFDGGPDGEEQGGDRISFFELRATQGVVADLRTGIISNDGFGNAETMVGIESLGGDTAYVDTLYGNDSGNILSAGRGDNLYGFGGDDELRVTAAAAVIDGGDGVDRLRLLNDRGYLPDSDGDGNAELAPAMTVGWVVNLAAGTIRDGYLNVGTVTGIEYVSGSLLADDLRGDSGDNVLIGNAGNDVLRLQDGGDDNVFGGEGNDNIFFIGSLTSADIVVGGSGIDTLVLQGPYGSLTLAPTVNQIENISILGGNNTNFGEPGTNRYDYALTVDDFNFAAGVQARINASALLAGEDFTFNGSAETDAKFVVYGGKGVDTLTGGQGNDIFFFAEDRFASGDIVNGGAGYDGMFLRGFYIIDFNAPGYTGLFTNIENLTLTSATDERYARGGGTEFDYNLILADAIVGAGQTLTVSGALLMANETMVVVGNQETNGFLRLFGGAANDTLIGGANADLIHGYLGADEIQGGGGADIFRYQATAESNGAAGFTDRILDFAPGTDKIELDRIDANTLVAGDQAFTWIGSNAFTGSAGQLRVSESGSFWIVEGDVNGDGLADLYIGLDKLGPTPLGAGDFVL